MSAVLAIEDVRYWPASASLLGRDRELALLGEFLDRAAAGGGALLVTGEAGIGKTALLDAAAHDAAARGTRVLRGCAVAFEADVRYAGLHQLLAPLAEETTQLASQHRRVLELAVGFAGGQETDQFLVCNAVLALIRRVAEAAPLLMIIDDAQWLDPPAASVLGFVARRLSGTSAGLLTAARTDSGESFQHSVGRHRLRAGPDELELRPLDETSAAMLLNSTFPQLDARTRRQVLAVAGGNPLAVLELPTALADLVRATGARQAPVLPLGRRLTELYAPRLAGLPPRSRAALLTAALDDAAEAELPGPDDAGLSLADLLPAERARLVELCPGSRRLRFRHPLIRSAVVALASADERRQAHRRLAELTSAQPARRAWHLAEAAIGPDEEVAALLERSAAATLRRGDGAGAFAALTKAAELSPAAIGRARRLAGAAYLGASVTGDLRRAQELLAEARRTDPDLTASAEIAVAASFLLINGDGDVVTAYRLLLGALGSTRDVNEAAAIQAVRALALTCRLGGQPEFWDSLDEHLRGASAELPASIYLTVHLAADPAHSPRAALDRLDAEIGSLPNLADPAEIVRIAGASAYVDRLPRCRQILERIAREELDAGAVATAIHATTLLAYEAYQTGHWHEALRLAEDAAELSADHGFGLQLCNARTVQAYVAAECGNRELTQALADEMFRWAATRGVRQVQACAQFACARAAMSCSDFEAAYRHATAISPAGQLAVREPFALLVFLDLIDAALRTGRTVEAAAHNRAVRQAGVAGISPRLALLADAAAALVALDEEACRLFERALSVTDASRWPFDLARVHLLYGERLRRSREMTRSRMHFAAAQDIFRRLGAVTWADRAAQELRATGQTRQGGDQHHTEALTPQEREIALLAAGGLTNKEIGARLFLSHRTVGAHLYRIFPKLGITTRAALRDALAHRPAG